MPGLFADKSAPTYQKHCAHTVSASGRYAVGADLSAKGRGLRSDPGPIRSLRQRLQGSDANALNPQLNLTQVAAIGPETVFDEVAAAVGVDDQRAAGAGAVAGAGDEYARQ